MTNKLNRLLSSKDRGCKPVASTTTPHRDTINTTKNSLGLSKESPIKIDATKSSCKESSSSSHNRRSTHSSRRSDKETETVKRNKFLSVNEKGKSTESSTAMTMETTVYTAKYKGRVSHGDDCNDSKKDGKDFVKHEGKGNTSSQLEGKSKASGRSSSRGSRHENKLSDSDRWSSIPDKLFRKNPLSRKHASNDKETDKKRERGNELDKNNRISEARDLNGNKSSSRWSSKGAKGERDNTTHRDERVQDDKQSSKIKKEIEKKKSLSSSSRLKPSVFMKRSQSTRAFKDSDPDFDRRRNQHRPSDNGAKHSSFKRVKDLDTSSSSLQKSKKEESFSSSARELIQYHSLPQDFAIPPKSSAYRRVDTESKSKNSNADRKGDKTRSSHKSTPNSSSQSLHGNSISRDRKQVSDEATVGGRATVTGLEIVPRLKSPPDDDLQIGLEIIPMKQPNHADSRENLDRHNTSSSNIHHSKSHRRGSSAGARDTGRTRRKSDIDLLTSQVSLLDFNSSNSHNDSKKDRDDDEGDDDNDDGNGKSRDKDKNNSSLTISNLDVSSRSGMSRTARSNDNSQSNSSHNNNTSGQNNILRQSSNKQNSAGSRRNRVDTRNRRMSRSQKDDDISLGTILDKRMDRRRSWSASPPREKAVDGEEGGHGLDSRRASRRKDRNGPSSSESSSIQALAPSRVEGNTRSRSRQSGEVLIRRQSHHHILSEMQRRNSTTRSISPFSRPREERNEVRKPSAGPHGAQRPNSKILTDSNSKRREDSRSGSRPASPTRDGHHQGNNRMISSGPNRRLSQAQRLHSTEPTNAPPERRDRTSLEDGRRSEGEKVTSKGPLRRLALAQRRQSKGDSRPLSSPKDESHPKGDIETSPGRHPAHLTRRNSKSLNTTSPTMDDESKIQPSPLSPKSRPEGARVTTLGRSLRAPRDFREINTLKSKNQTGGEGFSHNRPIRRTTVAHAPDDDLNTSLRSGGSKGHPCLDIESDNHLASMPNILGDAESLGTDMAHPSIISPDYEKIKRLCESIQRQQNLGSSKSNKTTTGQGLDDSALKSLRPLYKDASTLKSEVNEVKSLPLPILRHSRVARIPIISPPKKVPPPPPPPRKSISEGQAPAQNAVLNSGASATSSTSQGAGSDNHLAKPVGPRVNNNEPLPSFPQNAAPQHRIPASGLISQTIDPRVANNGPSPANTMASAPERSLQRSNSSSAISDSARQARNRKLMALAGEGEKQQVSGLSYNDRDGGHGLYTGEVDQWGRPNGEGKIEYDSGEVFEGQWVNGNRAAPTYCPPTGAPIIPGGSVAPNGGASIAPGSFSPGMYGGGASVAPGSIMGGMFGGAGYMMNPFTQAQLMQQQRMALGYPMMMQGQSQVMMQHPAQMMYSQMMPRPQFAGQQQKPNETQDQDSV
ncbi:hypothetical protein ACHAXS_009753 [Conticribra weissflogii]